MEEAQKQLAENGRKFETLKASAATWKSASNVKLQLCPTSDSTVYTLTRIECSPDEMNRGW